MNVIKMSEPILRTLSETKHALARSLVKLTERGETLEMLDERAADITLAALYEREDSGVYAQGFDGRLDRLGDDFARARMSEMSLDDNRTPRGERRCGIRPGNGKGERKVGCAENRGRAHRPLHQLEIGAGQGRPIRQCLVTAPIQVVTLFDMCREQAELAHRATALAYKARLGQPRLLGADLGDRLSASVDLFGDLIQKSYALRSVGIPVAPESPFGCWCRSINELGGADGKVALGSPSWTHI